MWRLAITSAAFLLSVISLNSSAAFGQAASPIKLVVAAPAGSGLDERVRDFTPFLEKALGQPVVVDNRPGQAGSAAAMAQEPRDGSVLYIGTAGLIMPPRSGKTASSVDTSKDIAPVSLVVVIQTAALASASTKANNVPEFVALARSPNTDLKILTEGAGSHSHLAAVWFARDAKVKFRFEHLDALKAHDAVMEQGDNVMFGSLPLSLDALRSKRIKALAISGKKRHPLFPDLATFAEAGLPDFEPAAWYGIFAPGGTPSSIIDGLAAAVAKAASQPQFVEKMYGYGAEATSNTPAEFARFVDAERIKWRSVFEASLSE